MAFLISSSLGAGFLFRRNRLESIIPGVQYPHWSPSCSRNSSCNGCNLPSADKPSIVSICELFAWAARSRHDFTVTSLSMTVQAPQWPVSHPIWVPVNPNLSRRKSTSSMRDGTFCRHCLPLTLTLISVSVAVLDASTGAADCCSERFLSQLRNHLQLQLGSRTKVRVWR